MVFFGYSSSHLGYRCFDITSQYIYISRHVHFHEDVFPFDNSEHIAKVSAPPPTQPTTAFFSNLLHSSLFTSHTALPPQSSHPPKPSPSLAHHYMHVYLIILLHVQLANQSHLAYSTPPLLLSG